MASNPFVTKKNDLEKLIDANDKTNNFIFNSRIPDVCKKEDCVAGIDEAGRGPVLGPMVYGIAYCLKHEEESLKDTGSTDSKALTEEKRENIFDKLCGKEGVGWEVDVISPTVISNSMLRRQKYSLNEMSHDSAISLIKRAIQSGVKLTDVFVDTVGPPEKYQAKLKGFFPELNITVSKKADSKFPIVGAASIFAKVTRDVCLKNWTLPELVATSNKELAWGSGYPTDPGTKKFLENCVDPVFGFPQLVRFSWSTAEKVLEEKAITVEWEDEELPKPTKSVKSYFNKENDDSNFKHRYFKDRNLTSVTNF